MNWARLALVGVMIAGGIATGCAHLPASGLPGPTPSPSESSTPTPLPSGSGSCTTQASNTTVTIVMSAGVAATPDPRFGVISGYTTLSSTGTFSNVATVITAHPTDIVQFANIEAGATPIFHSAVGFPGASFPPVPYTFPAAAQRPVGTAITSALWSTGRVAPSPDGGVSFCFSQQFTLQNGTWYFGDLDYYNLANMRDVIVVAP